jgi:hypothetical protein
MTVRGLLLIVRSSSEVRRGADSCSRGGSMRHVVLLGLAQESERRRAAGRQGAQIEGCARGVARAQAARASFSSRASASFAAISRSAYR